MTITSREAVILSIVKEQPSYGIEIREKYAKRTGRVMPLGSLYTTLNRMKDKKLIHPQAKAKLKIYKTTATGRKKLNSFLSSCNFPDKAVE